MITLKPALLKDYPFIAKIYRSVKPLYEPVMPGFSEACAVDIENESELIKGFDVSIIYADNEPVGFSSLAPLNAEITYLVAFYFLAEQHNKGYGSQALGLIMEKLKKQKRLQLILLVHKDALWAINFYKKNGFKLISDSEPLIRNYAAKAMNQYYLAGTILMGKFIK